MRTLALYLSLFFFLLIGKQSLYAGKLHGSDSSSQSISKNHRVRLENKEQGYSIIENADFDLEEDQLHGDDLTQITHLVIAHSIAFSNWYSTYCQFFIYNNSRSYKTFPAFCGLGQPIYITQRVLRI